MYDGNRACWTDFCDLIFRKGNEKFRTCVRVCARLDRMGHFEQIVGI